jgi:acyl carrier protein
VQGNDRTPRSFPLLPPAAAGRSGHASPGGSAQVATAASILDEVRGLLVEVIGEEYVLDLEIELDTEFQADLEIESIEFVALAEKLLERYGERVDFVSWLADKEIDDIIAMTVGDLVAFIETSLREGE